MFKIRPKALDNGPQLATGVEIVSMHKTVIFVSLVGGLCITLIVTMLLVRHCQQRRRRLCDPEFYKKRQDKSCASQSAREEFSEIRYLTEDEHLDFSLASPSSFRPQPAKSAPSGGTVPKPAQLQLSEERDDDGNDISATENETDSSGSLSLAQKTTTNKMEMKGKVQARAKNSGKETTATPGKKGKSHKKAAYRDPDNDNEGLLGHEEEEDEDAFREW